MDSRSLQLASIGAFTIAAVLLLTVQFVPWITLHNEGGGGTMMGFTMPTYETTFTGTLWDLTGEFRVGNDRDVDTKSWFNREVADSDNPPGGVWAIRIGIPILTLGLVAVASSLVLRILNNHLAFWIGGGGLAAVVAGTAFFGGGVGQYFRDVGDRFGAEHVWHVGLYLAIAAMVAVLVAGAAMLATADTVESPRKDAA